MSPWFLSSCPTSYWNNSNHAWLNLNHIWLNDTLEGSKNVMNRHFQPLLFNPYLTNGFSHHYQMGESTFILGASRVIFKFNPIFRMKILYANRIAQMGRHVLRRHIWGYSVCLCPIKGTPGLNELSVLEHNL